MDKIQRKNKHMGLIDDTTLTINNTARQYLYKVFNHNYVKIISVPGFIDLPFSF